MLQPKSRIKLDFDQHWQDNSLPEISQVKIREAEVFLRPVIDFLRTKPAEVLDVGCGDGVHWRYTMSLGDRRLRYTGTDISPVVIKQIRGLAASSPGRFYVADAVKLPEKGNTYNIVFSFGAVAYTSNPQGCFGEMCRVCKPGGWVGVWVYPQRQGVGGLIFRLTRFLCGVVSDFWTRRIADLIVPFLGLLPTRSNLSLRNATWQQCREVVLVNIAPQQLSFFTRNEVASWFSANGIEIKHEDPLNPITIWGRKQYRH